MTEDRRKNDSYLAGQMDIIKDMLADHMKHSRQEREEMREELSTIKTEITKYKFLFRAVVGTAIAILTFKFGDISSFWH
jgi:hypothetical protein